jgi:uncharacterized membrane protein
MKILLLLLGIVGFIAGVVLAAQGAGLVSLPQSSFITNASDGIVYGIVIAAIGLVLIGMSSRRS